MFGRTSISHLELIWEEPDLARFAQELGAFCRVILWEKRGVGLSDRAVGTPTLEDRMDDVRAVMDAVESPRAVLFGASDTAAMVLLFAATYPERTLGLILNSPMVRGEWAPDFPWVPTREEAERSLEESERDWGSPAHIDRLVARLAPSRMQDEAFKRWLGRVVRFGSSPSADSALVRMNMRVDVREALSAVHVPTLVMRCTDDRFIRPENSEYVASHVAGARLVTFPGFDHLMWANPRGYAGGMKAMREFIQGLPGGSLEEDRTLLTVLFVDAVGSTARGVSLGARAWGEQLRRLFSAAHTDVERYGGRVVKGTGDGLLAVFDGPTRAVRCARMILEHGRAAQIGLRAGLHTGECLAVDGDVTGSAVNIASRVCDRAGEGELLTSRTVRDLSVGSELRFDEREVTALKGLEGDWTLYAVRPT